MSDGPVLLTGFPANEIARRVLPELLEQGAHVLTLIPERFLDRAREWLSALPREHQQRTEVLVGDVAALDLGLSGREYLELAARVKVIHHCAAVTYSGAPVSMAERVNVGGTCEVLEFARMARSLDRLVHWSSIGATWDRHGVVAEDELLEPRSNPISRTRYRAEKLLAKARGELPITVLRTSMLVGDSRSGRLARIEGAHLLISALLNAPRDLPVLRPAQAYARLQVVPIDYAVDAGLAIAGADDTRGRTFHVIDPAPPTLDEALRTIAELLGKPCPRGGLPPALTQAMLRLPMVDRLVHAPRALLDELARDVRYDDRHARVVLARAGLTCPPLMSYVAKLVAHVERERKSDRAAAATSPLSR